MTAGPGAAPVRVLVVDDHPIVREGLVALLDRAGGVEVVGAAGDGEEAVALVATRSPDVVLMDLRMPGGDGVAATARITADHPGTRVLVLTTWEGDHDILGAVEAGARGYLLKAAPGEEILAGVRAVAAGETALSPPVAARLVARARGGGSRPRLSAREREVLGLVAEGLGNPDIARRLFIGEATVKTHLARIFVKLGVDDRTRAVTRALECGILPPPSG
ncbi:response regulator transcription factor [Streptomyces calidiresistens]|uniref:Response regulator n=1 Tax=Streptomyces calidiresistens TaxID=1485586 RepID=A0A7W3T4Z5_9ACTN|nr:response regulator [Streptomyces calidiresistens]MBB0231044.1 response regulator [Streptomyces calidiresistens]